ncbi:putative 39S ribosomal protein L11, mitochondrial-like [Capsicum annuum]|nr:putative 39S ribosomal protein L11, mitochondrial-like [Capsicum annuum]
MDTQHLSSSSKTCANVFIALVGAGVLGLPYSFKKTGWLMGRCTVDAMIVLSQAGFCISYLIFVANTLAHLFNNSVTNPIPTILGWSPKKVYIWSCFPLNSIPTLTRLAPLSIFVDVVDLGAMGVVMIEDVLIFLKNRTVLEAFDGFSVFFYDLGVLSVYVFEGVEWFYHWKQSHFSGIDGAKFCRFLVTGWQQCVHCSCHLIVFKKQLAWHGLTFDVALALIGAVSMDWHAGDICSQSLKLATCFALQLN